MKFYNNFNSLLNRSRILLKSLVEDNKYDSDIEDRIAVEVYSYISGNKPDLFKIVELLSEAQDYVNERDITKARGVSAFHLRTYLKTRDCVSYALEYYQPRLKGFTPVAATMLQLSELVNGNSSYFAYKELKFADTLKKFREDLDLALLCKRALPYDEAITLCELTRAKDLTESLLSQPKDISEVRAKVETVMNQLDTFRILEDARE